MDFREGIRRLALLAGVAGAIAGGSASFMELQTIVRYNEFKKLATSNFVQLQSQAFEAEVQRERTIFLAEQSKYESQMPAASKNEKPEEFRRRASELSALITAEGKARDEAENKLLLLQRSHTDVQRNGIKRINWTGEYAVNSIDTTLPWPRRLEIVSIET